MIWIQGLISFLVWIGYGFFQARRSEKIRAWVCSLSRQHRAVSGALLIVVGMAFLFGGLFALLQMGGFTATGLTPVAWGAVTLLGLLFVHFQTLGTGMLVSLIGADVTNDPQHTSINTAREESKL
jgi:hypothetical protein